MIVSIHQPSYFPWLGLLHKIARSDTFVVMDEVQLADRAFQHRNLFLDSAGQARYLSIPFVRAGYRERTLAQLQIAVADWPRRHLDFLRTNYGRHPNAEELLAGLAAYYATPHAGLFDAILASMKLSFALLGIRTRIVRQSTLDYDRGLRKGQLIAALVRATGASVYLSGTGAQAYLAPEDFAQGPQLRWSRFVHPAYPQKNAQYFVEGLSCLDLLFNVGPERASALLREECGA